MTGSVALLISFSSGAWASGVQPRSSGVNVRPACCAVTAIDTTTGLVTARDGPGRSFQFRVADRAVLGSLRVGQPVYADFTTNHVALTPGRPCCAIVAAAPAPRPPVTTPAAPPATAPPVQGTAPSVGLTRPIATGLPGVTGFRPKVHGFEFTNSFTGDILIDLPLIGRVDLADTTYGLCGGMVFSALDTFNLGAAAPDSPVTPPESGTPMRSYLYDRQVASLKYDNWFLVNRLVLWIRKPLHDQTVPGTGNVIERGLIHLSAKEFKSKIQPELDAGHPVPIVLVKADGNDYLSNPKAAFSKNHQVLAIGYHKHGEEWDIDIYDPNFPNTIQTLHTGGRYQTPKGATTRTGAFRGYFRIPYRLERPPWVADTPTVTAHVRNFPGISLGRPDSDD
ncbi:MAG TPA: hypothetical protein VNO23_00010 [Candidatus Binatia bacterium]|nr:hypothetical protein [Candidatus Binatia bacterium]